MSEIYETIIPNIKDEEGDDVILKMVFNKNIYQDNVSAEAFDSKGRYFYAKKLEKELEYYINQAEEENLELTYCEYEGIVCIELQLDKWSECDTLNEDKNHPYHLHLQSINDEISEATEKIKKLKKKKLQAEKFYGNNYYL